MASETYVSGRIAYKITVNPPRPMARNTPNPVSARELWHQSPYREQIHSFAHDLAGLGYLTAVPQCCVDDEPHPLDTVPKNQIERCANGALLAVGTFLCVGKPSKRC